MMLYMLKPNSEAILKAIAKRNPDQRRDLKLSDIAIEAGVSVMTVRRHIRSLAVCGYLKTSRAHTGQRYTFDLQESALKELSQRAS